MKSIRLQKGFTLIEIMVVVFIIAISAGLAVITVGNNSHRQLDSEAQRLLQIMQRASEKAVVDNSEIGFYIDEDQKYSFYEFDDHRLAWKSLADGVLAPHVFPERIMLSIDVENEEIDLVDLYQLNNSEIRDFGEENFIPTLLLTSDGQVTPFEIHIGFEDVDNIVYTLKSDGVSGFRLQTEERAF
ncbi:MAG: type II secretion system minor pseudopilin GspH [Pseudomonadales bacterium]|nr:type II secretion system minor pseudopilin GspH [Pseudomonadales bacterium]